MKEWKTKGALLITRLVIVLIFLYHGLPKAFNPSNATSKFVAMGFPGFLGPIVGWVEVIAAVLILLGIWNSRANIVLAIIIVVAIIGVHLPAALAAGKLTAGLERDLLIVGANLVLAAFGPGLWALQDKYTKLRG